jgi:hypothetical protein
VNANATTTTDKPVGRVVGRIVPKHGDEPAEGFAAYIPEDAIRAHPLVAKARAVADGLLDEARRKGTRLVADAYANAVRSLHNEHQLAGFRLNGTVPRTVR